MAMFGPAAKRLREASMMTRSADAGNYPLAGPGAFMPEAQYAGGGMAPDDFAQPPYMVEGGSPAYSLRDPIPSYMQKMGAAPSSDPAFNQLDPRLTAPMPAPTAAPRKRGLFGGGIGKVLGTIAGTALMGPAYLAFRQGQKDGAPMRDLAMERERAQIDTERAQGDYYRAQADAKDDGLLVVGNKLIDRNTREVIMDGRAPGERESLLAELDNPETPPERAANIKRVLGITPAPQAERAPQYQTDDNGNVFEIGPDGVRKVGGGLYKRPPEGPQPRETSPNDVVGGILERWRRGIAPTPYEQSVLDYAKPTDPMDTFMRRMLPGGGAGTMPPPPAAATRPPPRTTPNLDANGNVPNPFGANRPPPLIQGRGAPPRPNPAGGNSGARVRLPAGYTPARARQEAAATIKRNPRARAEVIRRLQESGVPTTGL